MIDQNEFCLIGTVKTIEEKQSKAGRPWWIVTVTADGEDVPLRKFGGCDYAEGIQVRVVGKLGNFNGFLTAEKIEWEVLGTPAAVMPPRDAEIPESVANGDLPF